ncbi:MAG TPA: ABC transporter permease [Vicinamibacterales bacterium]|jgi:predicted permease|nr:ABC transporter permease [Vicinamibacterales bacterium]
MTQLLQDLRFGVRLLWKQKGFAFTAILTLAACIGANATIFSVVNAVLLRALPFPDADRLVTVMNSYPGAGVDRASNGVPDYFDRRRETDVFDEQALYRQRGQTIGMEGQPERIQSFQATPTIFRVLKAEPHRGRLLNDSDGEVGQERKVVLSYTLWQRLYGGRDDAIGKDLRINGVPHVIVGVLPRDFLFLTAEAELWVPVAFAPEDKADDRRHSNNWQMIARLKPGRSVEQAQSQIDALNARNMERFPQFKEILTNAGFRTKVVAMQPDLVRDVRATLFLLWGGVAFVLLIGCVNLTNLSLVRSSARLKELATRHALGAGRSRLARQLLTETVLLTIAGAALGLAAAYWALGLLVAGPLADLPRAAEIGLDAQTVAFTIVLALAVGAAISLIPIAGVTRMNLSQAIREEGRSGTAGRGARIVRRVLVASQVAFAFMLLAAAGLLLASFQRVLSVDPGFKTDHILTGNVNMPASRYKDDAAQRTFIARVLERIRALPGVVQAGATTTIPFGGANSDSVILAEGYQMKPGESLISPAQITATPGYFETLRIPLIAGRFFSDADTETSPRVIIIDDELANRFWPGQSPIGRRMWQPDSAEELTKGPGPKARFYNIVGVVRRVSLGGLVSAADDQRIGAYYFPYAQVPDNPMTFAVRTAGDPSSLVGPVRREITALDPELPFYTPRTIEDLIDASLANRRTPMMLAVAFGVVALFLAAVGIYGVLAYQVTQRTREMGIRMALGSNAVCIFRLVIQEGAILVAVGFVLGLIGAVALRTSIASQLYDVQPLDPLVLGSVAGLLGAVALFACAVPARRASRIDPLIALTEH